MTLHYHCVNHIKTTEPINVDHTDTTLEMILNIDIAIEIINIIFICATKLCLPIVWIPKKFTTIIYNTTAAQAIQTALRCTNMGRFIFPSGHWGLRCVHHQYENKTEKALQTYLSAITKWFFWRWIECDQSDKYWFVVHLGETIQTFTALKDFIIQYSSLKFQKLLTPN